MVMQIAEVPCPIGASGSEGGGWIGPPISGSTGGLAGGAPGSIIPVLQLGHRTCLPASCGLYLSFLAHEGQATVFILVNPSRCF